MSSQLWSGFIKFQAVAHLFYHGFCHSYTLGPVKVSSKKINYVANEIHFVIAYLWRREGGIVAKRGWNSGYIHVLLDEL